MNDRIDPIDDAMQKALGDYSIGVLRKAEKLAETLDAVTESTDMHLVYKVLPRPGVEYRVQIVPQDDDDRTIYVTCTCANGQALGGSARCYHSAAAIMTALV